MPKLARIAIVVIVVAALAAGALLLFLPPIARPGDRALELDLARIDQAMAAGYASTARELLQGRRAIPGSEQDWLALLKRAFKLSMSTGDAAVLAALAARALAAHGGSPPLRAIAGYAHLRAGKLSDAEKVLSRGRLPAEIGALLQGEALLRRGGKWSGADSLTRDLLSLEQRRDPSAFDSAALRTGDRRLALDAALLRSGIGDLAGAAASVERDLDDAAFDEAAASILVDAGELSSALSRLDRLLASRPHRADVMLMRADCLWQLGRIDEAEQALRTAVPLAPDLSWTAYANLAFVAELRGDLERARRWIDGGFAFFPGSRGLDLALARLAMRGGGTAEAIAKLAKRAAEQPQDAEAVLLLLDLEAPSLSPEEYRARLWKLFNRVPADASVFGALASILMAARDWEGASISLEQHRAAAGALDERFLLVQGTIAAMRGEDAAAQEAFTRAASRTRDGSARYDLALLMLRKGNARAALAQLEAAASEFEHNGAAGLRDSFLSRVATQSGWARMLDGDSRGARIALGKALELEPGNLRAALLLRKLEAERQ
jgi:Flp pilus assembly protein TadD